jgi:hypothetical protein
VKGAKKEQRRSKEGAIGSKGADGAKKSTRRKGEERRSEYE